MNIYTPDALNGFELCHPVDHDDFETIKSLINGESRQNQWSPLHMRLIHKDEGQNLLPSDSPWLGVHTLIFKRTAIDALDSMLRWHGELLPLTCTDAEIFLYNPTHMVDALDENASTIRRFSTGRIMDTERYVFSQDTIRGLHIFKIPNLQPSPIFVSQQFVDLWISAGLKGLQFERVWLLQ